MKKTQLFIAGIPGSGKSSFGTWLSEQKGFTYIDMERDGLDQHGFRDSWEKFRNIKDASLFMEPIRAHPSSIVLDWGFPPSCLNLVRQLKDAGLMLFWFEGDPVSIAR